MTLQLEEISAVLGGLRAGSQAIDHLITTLKPERRWNLKNLWSEYYKDMIKTAIKNKTRRMNRTELYTRLVPRSTIIINEMEFAGEEK